MATLSSPGIGSGLDIRNIVSQLVELEKRPLQQVQKRTERAQVRLSSMGEIKSRVAALDDALKALTRPSTFREKTLTSGSPAIGGSAVFTATPATYAVQVNQLAKGQTVQSVAMAAGDPVGAGTLTLQMGRWNGASFTADDRGAITIDVTATDTLADVAAKINAASAPVSASVINDAAGARLVLRSRATGEAEGFRLQASDADGNLTDGAGLSRLLYDPENQPGAGLALAQAAQDTVVTIDGVPVRSTNNTIANAIAGVTLNVSAETPAAVNVQIGANPETARKAIGTLVEAFNALDAALADALRYDARTREAGPLQGDSAIVTLQASLRRMLFTPGPDGRTLSDLGVRLGRDGKLTVDEGRLGAALADAATLETTLAEASQGIAVQWRSVTSGLLQQGTGRLDLKRTALEGEIERLRQQQQRLSDKVARTEERLLAQYSRLDKTVSQLNALNQYVAQQVTQWNKAKDG